MVCVCLRLPGAHALIVVEVVRDGPTQVQALHVCNHVTTGKDIPAPVKNGNGHPNMRVTV